MKPSLRDTIIRKRRVAKQIAITSAVLTTVPVWLAITGMPLWEWLPLLAWQLYCTISSTLTARRTRKALELYDASPAAAYIAEVRHAFGGGR